MRLHACLRTLAVLLGIVAAYASESDPSALFPVVAGAALVWAVVSGWRLLWRTPRASYLVPLFIVDFLVVLPLTIELAGATGSHLLFMAPLFLALGTGYFKTPQVALWWAVATLAAATPAVIDLAQGVNGAGHALTDWLLIMGFVGVISVISAYVRDQTVERLHELELARTVLAERAAAAESASRKRFRRSLTGDPLARLQAARAALENGGAGEANARARARTSLNAAIDALRDALSTADPRATSGDLGTALENLVYTRAAAADVSGEVWVEREALGAGGDALMFRVARELVESALSRPGVSVLDVRLVRERGGLSLQVSDDGTGERATGSLEAFWRDDIALAATLQRVEAAGGQVSIERRGATVSVRVSLPAWATAETD